MRWWSALILCCLLAACAGKRTSQSTQAAYSVSVTGQDGWVVVEPGSADAAWWNADLRSTIYAASQCGTQYEDSSLDRLASHLTSGLDDRQEVERAELFVGERAALLRVVEGHLDGVPVRIAAVVFKRNRCNFDLLFIAPPHHYDEGREVFMGAVQSFSPTDQG